MKIRLSTIFYFGLNCDVHVYELVSSPHPGSAKCPLNQLGLVFGRTDFSRIFILEPPAFVADFVAGIFSIFVGKSVQRSSPGHPQQNPPN